MTKTVRCGCSRVIFLIFTFAGGFFGDACSNKISKRGGRQFGRFRARLRSSLFLGAANPGHAVLKLQSVPVSITTLTTSRNPLHRLAVTSSVLPRGPLPLELIVDIPAVCVLHSGFLWEGGGLRLGPSAHFSGETPLQRLPASRF